MTSIFWTILQGAELELTPPGTKEASDVGKRPDDMNGGDSISALTLASKSLSRTGTLPSGGMGGLAY